MKKHLKNFIFSLLLCLFSLNLGGCVFIYGNTSTLKSELIDARGTATTEALLEKVSPAVVGIYTSANGYTSIGTGVCVSENGYILTNNHVIEDATNITLYLYDGTTCKASTVWRDINQDLAVIKSSQAVPYLPMAKNNSYKTGETVFAIGTPIALQFKHTATQGIISATNRTLQIDTSLGASTLANLIQHDASINPGNSGGPLINTSGEIIGINTAKITDAEGLGFAIPIEIASPVVKNLNTDGYYQPAYMGVFGYDVGFSNGFNRSENGVYVYDIAPNSPASTLNLSKGDKIIKINNKDILNSLDFKCKLYAFKPNEKIDITYTQNGETLTKQITLTNRPK